jgi:hypothetical protein
MQLGGRASVGNVGIKGDQIATVTDQAIQGKEPLPEKTSHILFLQETIYAAPQEGFCPLLCTGRLDCTVQKNRSVLVRDRHSTFNKTWQF